MKPAVLFDRDGTILTERGYLADPDRMAFYPGAAEAMRALRRAGFLLVVVTNQSGIARGYFTRRRADEIHARFRARLARKKVRIDRIYLCPHGPGGGCRCRKPAPGMALRAARDLRIDLRRSYVVGDQARDMQLARRVGAKGVLVLTGGGRAARRDAARWAAKITSNLRTASRWIVKDSRK